MNAVHDVERLIADWLVEEAPAHALDRILGQAASVIDRTRQRRFLAAWRETMGINKLQLLAGAAVLIVALLGAGFVGRATGPSGNVGAPGQQTQTTTPLGSPSGAASAPATGVTIQAYRAARNAVCSRYVRQAEPLSAQFDGLYDAATSDTERSAKRAALDDLTALYDAMAIELLAVEAPSNLQAEHAANVAGFQDIRAILVQVSDLIGQGKLAEASALDQATDRIGSRVAAFERQQFVTACP